MPSLSKPLPKVETQNQLAELLAISEFELKRFCLRTERFYTHFEMPKRGGKGSRTICAPNEQLKQAQKLIKNRILRCVEAHDCATAYRKGTSIAHNAAAHTGRRIVLNLDIENFFSSISSHRILGLFQALGYNDNVAVTLARLCCYQHFLPQGAPTSPDLANLICHRLDRRLEGLARTKGMQYTRYCDDISFSSDAQVSPKLVELINQIIEEEGFKVNKAKTRILSRRSRQTVTGLTVNEKVSVPRRRRRVMRAALYRAQQGIEISESEMRRIQGFESFVNMVNRSNSKIKTGLKQLKV